MEAAWRQLHQEIHAAFTRWGGGDPMLLDLRSMCTHCVDMRLVCLLKWLRVLMQARVHPLEGEDAVK